MKNMNFKLYVDTLKSEVIEFNKGCEWDNDKWNSSYIDFKSIVNSWNQEYIEKHTGVELAIEFAREFYQETNCDTHDYWVVKKVDGWYCARTSKPKKNFGVMVFIPEEDNHQTSGMWDVSEKWVLLDEYRVPTSEVTAWRYLYDDPTNPEFLEYKETDVDIPDCKIDHTILTSRLKGKEIEKILNDLTEFLCEKKILREYMDFILKK